jgi:serine/threonine protein kinase
MDSQSDGGSSAVTPDAPIDGPAHHLLGLLLPGGWKVMATREPQPGDTGGYFSVGYFAHQVDDQDVPTSDTAFVRALDYSRWPELGFSSQVDAIQILASALVFEREMVRACAGRRMRNVVRGIDSGSVEVDGFAPFSTVDYLVFEVADGDVRKHLPTLDAFDEAWKLRVVHDVANGLRQLHQEDFAHQDLKPSNVLCFEPKKASRLFKVGDLGRAHSPSMSGPHSSLAAPGDQNYAPLELLYGQIDSDERRRRRCVDAYLLGSLVTFMFTGIGTSAGTLSYLASEFHPACWRESYPQVLPYIREAYNQHMEDFAAALTTGLRPKVLELVRELTDPDPTVRGNAKAGLGSLRFAMERYVSVLDFLTRDAEIRLRNAL